MKKFTLIELLVVIAIIGILTSIMLPSLSKAREKSISSVCISNLKQSLLQTVFYKSNNDDIMHMYENADPWGGWATKLETQYISAGDRSTYCPKTTPNVNSALFLKQKTYGGNFQALYKQTAWANRSWMIFNGSNYFKRIPLLPKPSHYIFLGDTISKGIWESRQDFENHSSFGSGDWAPISTTHNVGKKANAIYADGHAKSTSVSEWRELTLNSTAFDFSTL